MVSPVFQPLSILSFWTPDSDPLPTGRAEPLSLSIPGLARCSRRRYIWPGPGDKYSFWTCPGKSSSRSGPRGNERKSLPTAHPPPIHPVHCPENWEALPILRSPRFEVPENNGLPGEFCLCGLRKCPLPDGQRPAYFRMDFFFAVPLFPGQFAWHIVLHHNPEKSG